jgi:hypothetical protein
VDGDVKPKLLAAIKAEEEHQLRLLYTRESQWRLVNAQAGAAISSQTAGAEVSGWPPFCSYQLIQFNSSFAFR